MGSLIITGHCDEDNTYLNKVGGGQGSTVGVQHGEGFIEEEKVCNFRYLRGQDKILFPLVFSESNTYPGTQYFFNNHLMNEWKDEQSCQVVRRQKYSLDKIKQCESSEI